MKKKLAYVELDTHAEIANRFYELAQDLEHWDTDFYVSEKIIRQNNWQNKKNVFASHQYSILKQLACKNYHLVFIGTLHRYFSVFYKISLQFPCSIILHNLEFSFASSVSILKNLFRKDILYRLKLIFTEGFFTKNKVLKRVNHLFVLDEILVHFSNKNLKYLGLFYSENEVFLEDTARCIVIPGTVSHLRRNYHKIYTELVKYKGDLELKVVFLGKADAKELQELIVLKTALKSVEILFFTDKINQDTFDFWMKKAQFLWCPIQEFSEFFGVTERYAYSKMTGNRGDCIRYSKFGFFPKFYPNTENFMLIESDLETMLHSWNLNYDFQTNYSKQKIQSDFIRVLESL